MIKEYLSLGADPLMINSLNQTIVHIVAQCGYLQILTYLKYDLEMNIEEPDINGMTPLHLAIREGKEIVVGVLIA